MTVPHPSVAKLTLKSCLTFGGHSLACCLCVINPPRRAPHAQKSEWWTVSVS